MQRLVVVSSLVAALGVAPIALAAEPDNDAGADPVLAGPPEPPKPPDPKKGPPRPDDGSCDCRAAGAPSAPAGPGALGALSAAALVVARSLRRPRRY